jgi:O-antigen/teichoic acid export membrane protein
MAKFVAVVRRFSFRNDVRLLRLFKHSSILLSGNVASSVLGLCSLALTARALAPAEFGVLVIITTYVLIVDRIVNFQSWQALIKYGAEVLEKNNADDFQSILKFGFMLDGGTAIGGAILATLLAFFAGPWANLDSEAVLMAAFYSITIAFNISGPPIAILRLFEQFKLFSVISVIGATLKFLGVFCAFLLDAKLWVFVIVWAISDVFGKVLLLIVSLMQLKKRKHERLEKAKVSNIGARFPGIWGFVLSTNFNASIRMASREVDVLVIGALLSPASVGLYKIAKQISSILSVFTDPLYQSIYPELVKLRATGEIRALIRLAFQSSLVTGVFAIIFWLLIATLGNSLLFLVFGADFVGARGVMLWYLVAVVISVIGFPLTPMMLTFGKPHIALWIYLISTIIYFMVLYSLVNLHGLVGAGMAYVAFYIVWTVITFLFIALTIKKEGGQCRAKNSD